MTVYGYVTDQNKNPLSGAQVSIVDDMGSFIGINTTSGASGYFYLDDPAIDPANDQVYVNAPGYVQTVFPVQSGGSFAVSKQAAATTTAPANNNTATAIQTGANILTDILKVFSPRPTPIYNPAPAPVTQQSSMSGFLLPAIVVAGLIFFMKKKRKKTSK